MKEQDIKVSVTFTDGYQKRYTEACLRQLQRREKEALENEKSGDTEAVAV